jgi:hypothetical protein
MAAEPEPDPEAPRPERLRLTTGSLMVWIAVVAVCLSVAQGDVADWLPNGLIGWIAVLMLGATAFLIPWLEHRYLRSPESLEPPSVASRKVVNLLVLGLVGCMACAIVLLAILFVMILGKT